MQRDLLLLHEMIDAAEQAQRLVVGYSAADVAADRMRRDSLLWNFTVLGEAAALVSDETKARFPGIPRRNPVRLRNRVVHGYWSVDVEVLHTTAAEQLGEFVRLVATRWPPWRRTRDRDGSPGPPTRDGPWRRRAGCERCVPALLSVPLARVALFVLGGVIDVGRTGTSAGGGGRSPGCVRSAGGAVARRARARRD